MSDVHDDERPHDATDLEEWEEEEPRSGTFQALWFRLLLVLVVVGAAAAVSAPYLLTSSPSVPDPPRQSAPVPPPSEPVAAVPAPATEPAAPAPPAVVTPLRSTVASPSPEAATSATQPSAPSSDRKVVTDQKPTSAEGARPAAQRKTAAVQPSPRPVAKAAAPSTRPQPPASLAAPVLAPAPQGGRNTDLASAPRATDPPSGQTVGGERGEHWVQVGAFRDPSAARQLATRLREQHFRVEESMARPAAASGVASADATRYTVVVPTATPDATMTQLRGLRVTAEPGADGLVVTPALPLREAVALAKTLTSDGLRVQVRRTSAPAAATSPDAGAEAFHRVRVGAFPDRASAMVAVRALEARGYQAFVTREAR